MKTFYLIFFMLVSTISLQAQNTFVYFHNNTNLSFTASTSGTPDAADWDGFNGTISPLQPHVQVMRLFRDWISSSSSAGIYHVTTTLTFPTGETVDIQMEYDVEAYSLISNPFPEINFRHSADGSNFANQPWRNDNAIHEENTFTVNGVDYILRYQSYSTVPDGGIYDDVLFSIYEADDTPYSVIPADLADANTLNVMSYNVFLRPESPAFPDDQSIRSQHIADYTHDMDVIILQEAFDNAARPTLLAALAAEYPYQSSVVDDTSNPLEDGGVVIVSRFPFDSEDQLLWGSTCHDDDCVSNKGIKYVRVNKNGKYYHVFGTHMDAFNEVDDINTRKAQLVMWKNYIDSKNIPSTEAVLMGGDYNVDKFANKLGEYDTLFGNFAAVEPTYLGFPSTWDPTFNLYNLGEPYAPEFLDFVFHQGEHLPATTYSNESLIMRSNHIDMWRIFDLSDHYAIWGRFVFPDLPVELLAFNGIYDNEEKKVDLFWETASELNNKKFIIEKSEDGINFREIAEIEGAGNSSENIRYTHPDFEIDNDKLYYRLRQIDFDGTENMSDIIAIKINNKSLAINSIYPNPVRTDTNVFLQIKSEKNQNLMIEIMDAAGKKYRQINHFIQEGSTVLDINTSDLPKGLFIVRITNEYGETDFQKLVKM